MDRKEVKIKSFKYGFEVILDKNLPFQELLEIVKEKFLASSKFFGNSTCSIAFKERALSSEEEKLLIEAIESSSQLKVLSIIDRNPENSSIYLKAAQEFEKAKRAAMGNIYFGTIRGGKIYESPYSLIIAGDVNPGAKVICGGSVIVLGSLKGEVIAGNCISNADVQVTDLSGGEIEENCIVYASEFKTNLVTICGVKAEKNLKKEKKGFFSKELPQYAIVENNAIELKTVEDND